jgi:hypothetical protein
MTSEQGNDVLDSDYDSTLNIYQRIQRVKQEVSGVDKRGRHAQNFAFIKHDDVTAALSGLFVKFGIDREVTAVSIEQRENVCEMWVAISWVNVDRPEDRKTVRVFAEGVNVIRQNGVVNKDGLATGKALSYAVKMAELKNFCLVGDTTPDAERGGGSFESAPQVAPPSSEDYAKLVELYKSCSTVKELQAIREILAPLVGQKKLTPEQVAELSTLDADAKKRSK